MSRAQPVDDPERLSFETAAEVNLDLAELVELMERIEWADVPGISQPEAAAWTARLIEARDAVRDVTEG